MPLPARRSTSGRSRRAHRGQALVEFTFVVPVLLLLFTAILQFAMILGAQIGINNAVRDAARQASIVPTWNATQAAANGSWIFGAMARTGTNPGLLAKDVQGYVPARLDTSSETPSQVCYTGVSGASVSVEVQVSYRHPLIIPLVANVIDGLDGRTDGALQISASETIPVENPSPPQQNFSTCVSS